MGFYGVHGLLEVGMNAFIVDAILPSGQTQMIEVPGTVKGLPEGDQEIVVRT